MPAVTALPARVTDDPPVSERASTVLTRAKRLSPSVPAVAICSASVPAPPTILLLPSMVPLETMKVSPCALPIRVFPLLLLVLAIVFIVTAFVADDALILVAPVPATIVLIPAFEAVVPIVTEEVPVKERTSTPLTLAKRASERAPVADLICRASVPLSPPIMLLLPSTVPLERMKVSPSVVLPIRVVAFFVLFDALILTPATKSEASIVVIPLPVIICSIPAVLALAPSVAEEAPVKETV